MSIDTFDWSAIKPSIDIAAFVTSLIGTPSRTEGSRFWWCCPLHGERTASFKVNAGRCDWICFGCGQHGDAADLVEKLEGLPFPLSAKRAAEIAGLGYRLDDASGVQRPHIAPPPPKPVAPDRSLTEAEALAIVEEAEARLWTPAGEKALAYLRDERGLSDETIRKARLGLADGATARKQDGVEYQFSGVVVPWFDDGRLVRLKVQCLRGRLKYLSPFNTRSAEAFPSADAIQPGRPIVLVEGEFDVLLVGQELEGRASVVTLGSAATGVSERVMSAVMFAGRLFIALDGHDAGEKAAERFPFDGTRVKPLDGHKDWTDAHRTGRNRIRYW
jgi:DNA primase